MEAYEDTKPVISSKQVKKTLSSKNKKVCKVRNVFASPHQSSFWPALNELQDGSLLALIERLLPPAKLPESTVDQPQPTESCKELRSSLLLGVNAVSRSLEKLAASAVILAGDINPPMIGRHVLDMCCGQQVPVVVMPSLRQAVQTSLGFACIALGLKCNMAQDGHFAPLYDKVAELALLFPKPRDICFQQKEEEIDTSHEEETHKMSKQEESPVGVYKYRTSKKERVFVPCEVPMYFSDTETDVKKSKHTEFSGDFISFDLDVKPKGSTTLVSGSNLTTAARRDIVVSKKRKLAQYQPLIVKSIRSNPNKEKIKKKKKKLGS